MELPSSPFPSSTFLWDFLRSSSFFFDALEQNSPRKSLLHSAMEHLNLAIQGQTRQSRPAESATLLYADVCMLLAEWSEEAKKWAGTSYHEVMTRGRFRPALPPVVFLQQRTYISTLQRTGVYSLHDSHSE